MRKCIYMYVFERVCVGLRLRHPHTLLYLHRHTPVSFSIMFMPRLVPFSCLGMLCYKNGSLTREKVRDASIQRLKTVDMGSKLNDPWSVFDRALEDTMIGNEGRVGFYYLEPEIIPTVNHTNLIRRFQIPSSDNGDSPLSLSSFPHPYDDIRACVEGAVISMRLHSASIGLGTQKGCQRVIVTGGGSVNKRILQIIADVFECDVYTSKSGPNAAALGACLRALHGYTMVYDADKDNGNGRDHGINDAGYDSNDLCNKYGKSFMPFHAILNPQSLSMSPPTPSPSNSLSLSSPTELVLQVSPTPSSYPVYRRMLMWYRSLECDIIKQFQ